MKLLIVIGVLAWVHSSAATEKKPDDWDKSCQIAGRFLAAPYPPANRYTFFSYEVHKQITTPSVIRAFSGAAAADPKQKYRLLKSAAAGDGRSD